MKKLIFIKFGGSLITDKAKINKARFDVIDGLAAQIKEVRSIDEDTSFIIATGAGGFGHPVAKKYENNLSEGLSFIKEAVKKINKIVVSSLIKSGLKAASVEPSNISEYKDGKMVSLFYSSIVSLLEKNIIPIFHADLVEDLKLGTSILSMDKFLVDMAISFKNIGYDIKKVIFCGTTDGVIDANGKTINKINNENIKGFSNLFYDNKIIDTSGGMKGKVLECLRLVDKQIPCILINGQKENNLFEAILGKEVLGTKF